MDNYFPKTAFFTEFERFDRFINKRIKDKNKIDFTSICSPSHLHDAHIRFGLKNNSHVICEKPVVLNPWNLEGLVEMEKETGKNIYSILQLRLHKNIIALKEKIDNAPQDKIYEIDLTYIVSRGNWYYTGWKGDISKSGGIIANIGIHFFDMLLWIFGEVKTNIVHIHTHDRAAGYLEFSKARVRWFLSINGDTLPKHISEKGQTNYRKITLDEEEIEFSEGFADLHTMSYQKILDGKGFRIKEAESSINLVHDIRNSAPIGISGSYHPFAKLPLSCHPFK